MTPKREALIAEMLRWDRVAKERGEIERRKIIWRIIDALEGREVDPRVPIMLDNIQQTDTVIALREELGIDDTPCWANKRSA
jgi:hypothetical protein